MRHGSSGSASGAVRGVRAEMKKASQLSDSPVPANLGVIAAAAQHQTYDCGSTLSNEIERTFPDVSSRLDPPWP